MRLILVGCAELLAEHDAFNVEVLVYLILLVEIKTKGY